MLVIDERVLDDAITQLRSIQRMLLEEQFKSAPLEIEHIIKHLSKNAVDLNSALRRGTESLRDEM